MIIVSAIGRGCSPGLMQPEVDLDCYEVDLEEREVLILAVGVKERNRLLIAGEEFES